MRRSTRRTRAREIRKRGFILSFGDIILPFVGVAAIGILAVAGKLFFVNGLQPSPSIASTQRELDIPPERPEDVPSLPLVDAGTPTPLPGVSDGHAAQPLSPPAYNIMDIPYGGNAPVQPKPPAQDAIPAEPPLEIIATPVMPEPAKPELPKAKDKPAAVQGKAVPVKPTPPAKPKAGGTQPTAKPVPKTNAAKPSPAKPTPKANVAKPTPASAKKPAQSSSWRVQVGAYGTKQAAEETVAKLAKSGYSATVFSGPRFHKVWVQGGSTKQAADATASRLSKGGYPGSYVVPPPAN